MTWTGNWTGSQATICLIPICLFENSRYGALGQLIIRHSQNVSQYMRLIGAKLRSSACSASWSTRQLVGHAFDRAANALGVQNPAEETPLP